MPINGVLDMQRRSVQLGEIRMGTSVEVPGKTYRRPVRLDTFRFTTASEFTALVIAKKYNGEAVPWSQRKGRWEILTDRTALDVWVPPRGEAVDANMELWNGPKRLRTCDGLIERISGKPCWCPHPDNPADPASIQAARDERKRLAGLRPPQACKPLTRINVTIPDLPGLTGVFRLNTGSENAAVETADSGDAMAIAREGGVYLPAVLRMEWRIRSEDGSPYQVPVLHIGLSMHELAQGSLPAGPSGLLAQLKAPEEKKALTAGPAPEQPTAATPQSPPPKAPRTAQQIADDAAQATTRGDIERLADEAKELQAGDDLVCTGAGTDRELYEELHGYLTAQWKALPAGDGK